MKSSTFLHQINNWGQLFSSCLSSGNHGHLCPLWTQVQCSKLLTTPTTDMDITGLNICGRKTGATKVSSFFGSQKTVSFQALLMDSFITFGSNFCFVSWYSTTLHPICQQWFTSKLENLRAGESLPYEGQQCLLQCLWLGHPGSTWIPPMKSTSLHHEVAFSFHHENVLGKSFEPWVPWLWPYRQPWTTSESSQRVSTVPCE